MQNTFGTVTQVPDTIQYILLGIGVLLIIAVLIICYKASTCTDRVKELKLDLISTVIALIGFFVFLSSCEISIREGRQTKNNIAAAILDNYPDAKFFEKNQFISNNVTYKYTISDNTLIIKMGELEVKCISGEDY